jgi:hypothetical protein
MIDTMGTVFKTNATKPLPALPLGDGKQTAANVRSATGTDDSTPSSLVRNLVPTAGQAVPLQSILDTIADEAGKLRMTDAIAASACVVKRKDPPTIAVNGLRLVEPTGIEPATSWMQTRRSPN